MLYSFVYFWQIFEVNGSNVGVQVSKNEMCEIN